MILTIGDAIVDQYIEHETVRPCPEGDWPIVREVRRYTKPGGASAVDAMLIAAGDDCRLLVSTMGLTKKIRVLIDGNTSHRIDEDRNSRFARMAAKRLRSWDISPDVVLIADYGKGVINRAVIEACLDRGWKVIVDPHPSQNPRTYLGVYGICPNRAENQKHGYALRCKEWPRFCLKLDKDGLLAFDHGRQKLFKSSAVQIVDCCGAGDQVLATLGVAIARGTEWIEACGEANAAAGRQCGVFGVIPT